MADLDHLYGSDLSVGPTGDIAVVDGTVFGQQRVLRRLLTNPGEYTWHLDYGAGLARFVGQPVNAAAIAALIRDQMALEASVLQSPEPVITVLDDRQGGVFVDIRYADAATGLTQALSFTVT